MNSYLALFRARFRALMRYRAAAWAGVVTQLVFGAVLIAMRGAFYKNASQPPPLTYEQMVSYSWLVQAFFALSPFTANPDPEVRDRMRDGSVAYELARPLDLYTLWFVRNVANRLTPALLRCGPILVLGFLFLGLKPPHSLAAFGAFLVTMGGALLLIAAWCTLISISLLWTISGDGIARMGPIIVMVFSGQIVPIALFPESLQTVLKLQPFVGMVDTPFNLWVGKTPAAQLPAVLAHQLLWTGFFVLLGRFLLNRGIKRLVVQGG
jgi:ABC-2 type transport system permease protein